VSLTVAGQTGDLLSPIDSEVITTGEALRIRRAHLDVSVAFCCSMWSILMHCVTSATHLPQVQDLPGGRAEAGADPQSRHHHLHVATGEHWIDSSCCYAMYSLAS
jgi:hypothetical protein